MPLPRLTRHAGRRLIATGAIAAVAFLGAPAVANAAPTVPGVPDLSSLLPGASDSAGTSDDSGTTPAFGGLPEGVPDFAGSIQGGAECVGGLVQGVTVSLTGIVGGLAGLGGVLADLLGQENPVALTETSSTTATGSIPLSLEDLIALIGPERLQELIEGGQESVTVPIELVVGGVTNLVQVVFDFVDCLASLIPVPAATTTPPAAAPTTQAPAPVPAVTTSAAPAQAVSYPGYAPTGGAPSDEGSPAALVGLGLLTAATGGGALWLRARRGVAG